MTAADVRPRRRSTARPGAPSSRAAPDLDGIDFVEVARQPRGRPGRRARRAPAANAAGPPARTARCRRLDAPTGCGCSAACGPTRRSTPWASSGPTPRWRSLGDAAHPPTDPLPGGRHAGPDALLVARGTAAHDDRAAPGARRAHDVERRLVDLRPGPVRRRRTRRPCRLRRAALVRAVRLHRGLPVATSTAARAERRPRCRPGSPLPATTSPATTTRCAAGSLDRLSTLLPRWTDRNPADPAVMLVELFAAPRRPARVLAGRGRGRGLPRHRAAAHVRAAARPPARLRRPRGLLGADVAGLADRRRP